MNKVILISLIFIGCFSESVKAFPFFQANKNNQNDMQVESSIKKQKEEVRDNSEISSNMNSQSFLAVFDPPGDSQPSYSIGGAVRGDICAADLDKDAEMTALVPAVAQSLTSKSHPQLFAYVPSLGAEKTALLVVKDAQEDYYHTQYINIPADGGTVKVSLSEDAPPLVVGQEYEWLFKVFCSGSPEPDDPQIHVKIKRVEANIPNSVSTEAKVWEYADNSLWYDSLAAAYALKENNNDTYWQQLLQSIGVK